MEEKRKRLIELMREVELYMKAFRGKWQDQRTIFLCNLIDDMLSDKLLEPHEHKLVYAYLRNNRPSPDLHVEYYNSKNCLHVGCVWFGNFDNEGNAEERNEFRQRFWGNLMKYAKTDVRFNDKKFPQWN